MKRGNDMEAPMIATIVFLFAVSAIGLVYAHKHRKD